MITNAYRNDIDGLRAIAVLFVVLYHAYPIEFNGGQVGVDIFFVISGYLITGLIVDDLSQGRFKLSVFYAKRIRRIFPALLTVLSASLLLGWFTLLSSDFYELGRQVVAGSLFVANFLFWIDIGYFDIAAEKKPLLHLWSLGIEEQFYIVFPVLFAITAPRFRRPLIASVLLVSLALYIWVGSVSPTTAFYLPHTRVWQILGGAALLLWTRDHFKAPASGNNLASVCGALLIFLSLYENRLAGSFASYRSLYPVLGTMLLLYGRGAWINTRVLSSRALVFIGRISFPLYLWHWLLLSFCHIFEDSKPFIEVRNPVLIISFLLAWLTYISIENPLRFGRFKSTSIAILVIPFLIVISFGAFVVLSGGVPGRPAAQVKQVNLGGVGQKDFVDFLDKNFYQCAERGWVTTVKESDVGSRCAQSQPSEVSPTYVLLGDSHAEHLFPGLAGRYTDAVFAYTTREGLPLVSNPGFSAVFDAIRSDTSVKGVLLSAHWASKLQNTDPQSFYTDLRRTLSFFTDVGKSVYLLDDVPIFPFNAERCAYADRLLIGNMCVADVESMTFAPFQLNPAERAPGWFYIDLAKYICTADACSMAKDGMLLYRDRNHLNINGSRYIADRMHTEFPGFFR